MERVQSIVELVAAAPSSVVVPCPPFLKGSRDKRWSEAGVAEPAKIAATFADPDLNVGLVIGDRIAVFDVEGPHKEKEKAREGMANLASLEQKLGTLTPTIETATPSGGRHMYYVLPEGSSFNSQANFGGQNPHNDFPYWTSQPRILKWILDADFERFLEFALNWLAQRAEFPASKPLSSKLSAELARRRGDVQ